MKGTIVDRARAGAAIILSSHLLTLVEELCTRVLVLQQGQRRALGTIPEIVAERPELSGRPLEEVFLALTGTDERQLSGGPADAPDRPIRRHALRRSLTAPCSGPSST